MSARVYAGNRFAVGKRTITIGDKNLNDSALGVARKAKYKASVEYLYRQDFVERIYKQSTLRRSVGDADHWRADDQRLRLLFILTHNGDQCPLRHLTYLSATF